MQILKGFKQDQVSWTVRVDLNREFISSYLARKRNLKYEIAGLTQPWS